MLMKRMLLNMISDKKDYFNKTIYNKTFFFSILLSFLLIIFSLKDFDFLKFKHAYENMILSYLLLASFLLMLVIYLRALRWKLLLNSSKRLDVNDLYKGQLIGYFGNNILPLRAGELIKAYYIGNKYDKSKSKIFGSIILERIFDFLGLFFLLLLLLNSNLKNIIFDHFYYGLIMILVFVFLGISISYFYNFKKNSSSIKTKIKNIISNILDGFASLNNNNFFPSIMLTLIIWSVYVMEVYIVQSAFNMGLSINHAIFILFVSSIFMILPGMPGNFGTFEGSVIYSFTLFGKYGLYNITDDFGFAFILHLVSFIPYTIFGFIYFITELKFFINKKNN